MKFVLWVMQILLAAFFLWHGMLFLLPPVELVEIMKAQYALWFRLFLGTAEVLAAFGLILPAAIRVLPWLTPLAAVGLTIVTASATFYHSARGETQSAVTTAILSVILATVAYMRWKVRPIVARTAADIAKQSYS